MEAILKREIISNKVLCRMLGLFTFVILTALGAFVRIPLPFTPVPLTLQTFFVLLAGLFLGARLGALSQLSYVFLGAIGFPIFSQAGSGSGYILGPTGGYLLGFILASFLVGRLIKYSQNSLFIIFSLLCFADLILLFCGVLWLKLIFGYPFIKLIFIGLLPFIPGDLLKAFFASFIYLKLKPRLKEVF